MKTALLSAWASSADLTFIAQLSDICISMQVDPDEPNSDIRHLHILKNRYTGQTGPAGTLNYNRDTGRLIEDALVQFEPVEDDEAEGETDNDGT